MEQIYGAKQIAGYWNVTSSCITLGGYELKDISLSETLDEISFVSQDNYLFIRRIHNGYNMVADSAGSHLSGGACQPIAIARTILKNASIIILNETETTSSVALENGDEMQAGY